MGGIVAFILIFALGIIGLVTAGMWKIFEKAGKPGWACLIPIYGAVVFFEIVGKPWWWMFLFCIPFVNYVFIIWSFNMLSKSFGKDEGFTAGLLLLNVVFIPLLGFGSAQYEGPYGDPYLFRQYQEDNKGGFDFENNRMV